LYGFNENKEAYMNQSHHDLNIGESLDGLSRKVKDFFGQIF